MVVPWYVTQGCTYGSSFIMCATFFIRQGFMSIFLLIV